jgi:hypothetical protein
MGAIGTHTLIQKITVGSAGAASIDFTNIPTTYTDLCLKLSARTNNTGVRVRFNGDTGTNYSWRRLNGNGAAAFSDSNTTYGSPYNTFVYWSMHSTTADTANTFGNGEMYIPNAFGSTYKSVSADSVQETNASTAYMAMQSGLWSSTTAINQITLTPDTATSPLFQQYSSASLYGISTSSVPASPTPQAQGGDIIVNDGTYWYHAFISTGAFVPKRALTADMLVVAGGGSGGLQQGAGGGAGGVLYTTSSTVGSGVTYTATVGGGGAGRNASGGIGSNGTNSTFIGTGLSLTAVGGGGGGYYGGGAGQNGSNGGSGGGGGGANGSGNPSVGGTATSGQGYAGGIGGTTDGGGGGGGAGAVGSNGSGQAGGNGGAGTNTYSSWLSVVGLGVSGYIAGGGGGGGSSTLGSGGSGGGTAGIYLAASSNNATDNTGSGSGGGTVSSRITGNGGSGLIIIRYPV